LGSNKPLSKGNLKKNYGSKGYSLNWFELCALTDHILYANYMPTLKFIRTVILMNNYSRISGSESGFSPPGVATGIELNLEETRSDFPDLVLSAVGNTKQ
jgi:hypothetical protein